MIILKTKWNLVKDKLDKVSEWAVEGLSEKQIAHNLGVSYSTFREYKTKYPALLTTLAESKEVADLEVENALYKRARGFSYMETKKVINTDGSVVITETVKEVPPDTTAATFWLRNRKAAEWKDKTELDMNTDITYTVIPCPRLEPKEDE